MSQTVRDRVHFLRPGLTALGAALLSLAGCAPVGGSLLNPAGAVADEQRRWLIEITAWMGIVVLPVLVLVPLVAWHARRRGRAAYRPNWTFSWPLEVLVWGVPAVIVVGLAWFIIDREQPRAPARQLPLTGDPLTVEVVALDWKWLFIYPEQHVASLGRLVIPQGKQIAFRLTSDSTMQSFFIPGLGSQIYVMSGMVTRLHLVAGRVGRLSGRNTQFNGMKFQDDTFDVDVETPETFRVWAQQAAEASPINPSTYATLSQPGSTQDAREALGFKPSTPVVFSFTSDPFVSILAHTMLMPPVKEPMMTDRPATGIKP